MNVVSEASKRAREILNDALYGDVYHNSSTVAENYAVSRPTARKYIKQAQEIAANMGITLAYLPSFNEFRIIPHGDNALAEEAGTYTLEHWRDAGQSSKHVFKGLAAQHFVTDDTARDVSLVVDQFDSQVAHVYYDIYGVEIAA